MKFIRVFNNVAEANTAGQTGMVSPHMDYIKNKEVNFFETAGGEFTCAYDSNGKMINVVPVVAFTVTLTTDGNGTVTGGGTYKQGTVITISASGNTGYDFKQWSDGNMNNPRQITVNSDINLGCSFEERIPNDEIWYTSSDGNVVTPCATFVFGATIISNTYTGGKGIIKFNGNVTSIGEYAFAYCNRLTGITIPDSVTTIGDNAFYNCTSLESVICNPTTPPSLGSNAFNNNKSGRKIKVPSGSLTAYKAATNWSGYASDIISQ